NHSGLLSVFGKGVRGTDRNACRFERFWVACDCRSVTRHAIDRHAMNDLSQPASEGFGDTQLMDLLHRLDENVLGEFFGLVGVANTSHGEGDDADAVTFEQFAERVL